MHKGSAANEAPSHSYSYCLAPHLFKWIPIQTMNWTVRQRSHHVTRGRHGRGNRQFGCRDANHRWRGREVGLVLPQLQNTNTLNFYEWTRHSSRVGQQRTDDTAFRLMIQVF